MITGMDRLKAALSGKVLDRIPVFCNASDQGARELGMTPTEYFSKGENVAEGQLRMLQKFGHDNAWGLFYVGKEAELLGCKKIVFSPDGAPNVEDYVIQSTDDIARLVVPSEIEDHPAFTEINTCMTRLRREVGGRHPICAYITATMTLPALLMGMENWLELLLCGPAEARDRLLEKCHEFFIKEVEAYRRLGADVLIYSNPFASTDVVSMKYFMSHSLPWLERDMNAVGSSDMVFYCGMARLNAVIPTVLARTGLSTYYLSPLDDLAEGKRLVGERGMACGVINDIQLIGWTRQEIRAEVRRILSIGMPGGKFLFGTGVMPLAIPEENIHTMLEAAYEFGRAGGLDP